MDKPGDTLSEEYVTGDVPCISCGYNLRTLAVAGSCPECGRRVLKTMRHALVYADLSWLRTLRDGAAVLAWTHIALLGCAVLCIALGLLGEAFDNRAVQAGALILVVLTPIGGFCALAVGVAKLTVAEAGDPPGPWTSARRGARLCLVALFFFGLAMFGSRSPMGVMLAAPAWSLLITLAAIHAGRLAKRGKHGGIAQLATATAWMGGILVGILLACAASAVIIFSLFPSRGGVGRGILSVGMICLGLPLVLVLVVLITVLMFRFRSLIDRTVASADAMKSGASSSHAEGGKAVHAEGLP